MKIDQRTNNGLLLQRKHSDTSSLEQNLAKLKVDQIDLLEGELKGLNLKEDDGKLIERGPITTKDTRVVPINKPYQKVTENVLLRHNCGGTAFCINHSSQDNYDNINNNSSVFHNNFEEPQHHCNECYDIFECDHCILQVGNSPEFLEHCELALKHCAEEPQFNITNTNSQTSPHFINPSLRRGSNDSGCGSDIPSPPSDGVMSPKPVFRLQPSKFESVTSNYRKILPKTKDMQRKVESDVSKMQNVQNKQNSREKSAKDILRATLNAEVKQAKWVEITVMKDNDEVFETSNDGQTILHRLLQNEDKYIAESLYAVVEKMKKNPHRCSRIIAAQSSICDVIKQNKHPKLWLDYFCEAMHFIKLEMEDKKSSN